MIPIILIYAYKGLNEDQILKIKISQLLIS